MEKRLLADKYDNHVEYAIYIRTAFQKPDVFGCTCTIFHTLEEIEHLNVGKQALTAVLRTYTATGRPLSFGLLTWTLYLFVGHPTRDGNNKALDRRLPTAL